MPSTGSTNVSTSNNAPSTSFPEYQYHPHTHEGDIIQLRNLFIECNQIMRIARDPHTLVSAKCHLQSILTNPTFTKSGIELLAIYGIKRGERVDDGVFEMMFQDPKEELLKWITRELFKVVNFDVHCYKRARSLTISSDQSEENAEDGEQDRSQANTKRARNGF